MFLCLLKRQALFEVAREACLTIFLLDPVSQDVLVLLFRACSLLNSTLVVHIKTVREMPSGFLTFILLYSRSKISSLFVILF